MVAIHSLVSLSPRHGSKRLANPRLIVWPTPLVEVLRVWQARRRYRADLKRLLQLGAYLIDDIGMGLKEAIEEARKPFWRG